MVLSAGAGAVMMLPHLTAAARLGTGVGTAIEVAYRNLALFGQAAQLRVSWGRPLAEGLAVGAALRSSVATLRLVPTELVGIQFADHSLGNEWDAGLDLIATWRRPERRAQVTFAIGPTASLAAPRTDTPEATGLRVSPFLRSITTSIAGEWAAGARRVFFLRLDGLVLVRAAVRPLGFLPTVTGGIAWGWRR